MFCSNCGKKIPKDSKYCEKCGTLIDEEENSIEELNKTEVLDDDSELEKTIVLSDNKEENLVKKITEEKTIVENEDKKDVKKKEKDAIKGSHTMLLSELNDAVADLKPDDFDELMPKSNHTRIIVVIVLLIVFLVVTILCFSIGNESKEKTTPTIDKQKIINEYAKSIEDVASEYLLDHEIINDFSEIKNLVKYKEHNVNCENVYINIDGTVYLSECSIDGKSVEEGYGKRKNILSKENDEACNVTYNNDNRELEFYIDGELISVYECNHDKCGLYEMDEYKYNSCLDNIALIEDGKVKYLYNYQAGQEVFNGFSEVAPIKINDKYTGFIVRDYETAKYGYITTRGTTILDFVYDELGIINDGKLYNRGIDVGNDKIIASKDGKYGVIKLSNGKEIIPFEYDFIYLGNDNNYVSKYGKKYYLISNNNDKIFDESYDMIFPFENVIVVSNNNKLSIIDYDGNKLIDEELDIYIDYKDKPIMGVFGYNAYMSDNNIIIEINKTNGEGYDSLMYSYNIKEKKLSELDKNSSGIVTEVE